MGIFSGERSAGVQRRDFGTVGQTIPPNSAQLVDSYGSVSTEAALTLSAVWACVRHRADLVSTLPVGVFRMRDGEKQPAPVPRVLRTPGGDRCDLSEWLYMGQVALDLRGNNYGVIEWANGYPAQVELLHPDSVRVYYDLDGRIVCKVDGKPFDYSNLWHEKAYSFPGMPVGLSPVAYAARMMGVALGAEKFGSDFFRDGAHPTALLTTDEPVDEQQAKTIKNRVMSLLRGNREPLVLGAGIKYQAIQVAPEESQFLATLQHGAQQACQFFNVDPELVGVDGGSSGSITYANREQRSIDYLTYKLSPTLVRRENALTRMVPGGAFVKFNTDALLRADLETQAKVWATRIAAKYAVPDEARHDIDMPPLTDEQKSQLELVPLTVTPSGMPKALPPAPAPAPPVAA